MDAMWYYVRGGVQNGPVSFDDLKASAASGLLSGTDLVWKEGTADWVPARTVPGLFVGPPPVPVGRQPEPREDHGNRPPRSGGGVDVVALAQEFLRRAVTANPASVAPARAESEFLSQAGITDPLAQRFAVWRRAVLWVAVVPTGFAALFGFINVVAMDKDETEFMSNFGVMLFYLQAFALFALPVAAVMGALAYDRFTASMRWVVLGGIVSLGVPLFVALMPTRLLLDVKGSESEISAARTGMGVVLGIGFYLVLMPSILSLLPAVSRSCMRVKTFLPESLVPGWGLVASVPLFVLLTLATFVLLYHLVGNGLLMIGLLLWVGAPLLYLTKFRLLTRPVTNRHDLDSLAATQIAVLVLILGGMLLIVIYMFTAKFMGKTIMGTDQYDSLIRPWSIDFLAKVIEYIGRSLFFTVLFADLMMRISLSVWREERAFAGTPGAAEFDKTMSGLTAAVEKK